MRLSKKLAIAAVATVAAVGAASSAFAYWTTSGSGTGSASAASGQVDHLGFTTASISDMFPGDSSQSLTVTVTNDATQNAYVASVKAYLTVVPVSGSCAAGNFKLNGSAAPGDADHAASLTWLGQDLAKSGGHDDATGSIQFNNLSSNQDGCKGAAVTLNYLAS